MLKISVSLFPGVVIRIGTNKGSLSGRQLEEAGGDRAAAFFLAVREQAELLLENGIKRAEFCSTA